MASIVFTGTATGHKDLLSKVRGHLIGGGMGAEAWQSLAYNTGGDEDTLYLKGTGLSGTGGR